MDVLAALDLLVGAAPDLWNRITRIAQRRFAVPFAAVTLMARDEQHIRSACGFAPGRTPRDQSFCSWTILHDAVFVVPDATRHGDLCGNPFVVGEPGIRFYAGAPLVLATGVRLGALCVIDTRPRAFSPADAAVLRHLARIAADEIWLSSLEGGFAFDPDGNAAPAPLSMRLTPTQIRGGRGMLGWSVEALASAAGVSPATVKRAETADRHSGVGDPYVHVMRHAMEDAGLEFTFTLGAAPGVRPRVAASTPSA
ncbi:GAF domain-containing protein [Mongoliimonas terrestris]|uniref:GAF domain-containing protein n=1 Tax=Mongoliimonas terrestris TaxID=1709001 RepID=UPI00094986C0|nr:GAF domain-containing protein [Mongoliimonas terrestris]